MRSKVYTLVGLSVLIAVAGFGTQSIYGQTRIVARPLSLTATNFSRPTPPPVNPDPRTTYIPRPTKPGDPGPGPLP